MSTEKSYGMVRIKDHAPIMQDFNFMRWPTCCAPGRKDEADDADMLFEAFSSDGVNFSLRAFGFGILKGGSGSYGNGAIHVRAGWFSNHDEPTPRMCLSCGAVEMSAGQLPCGH